MPSVIHTLTRRFCSLITVLSDLAQSQIFFAVKTLKPKFLGWYCIALFAPTVRAYADVLSPEELLVSMENSIFQILFLAWLLTVIVSWLLIVISTLMQYHLWRLAHFPQFLDFFQAL